MSYNSQNHISVEQYHLYTDIIEDLVLGASTQYIADKFGLTIGKVNGIKSVIINILVDPSRWKGGEYPGAETGKPDTRLQTIRHHKQDILKAIKQFRTELAVTGTQLIVVPDLPGKILNPLKGVGYNANKLDEIKQDLKDRLISPKRKLNPIIIEGLGEEGYRDLCRWAGVRPEMVNDYVPRYWRNERIDSFTADDLLASHSTSNDNLVKAQWRISLFEQVLRGTPVNKIAAEEGLTTVFIKRQVRDLALEMAHPNRWQGEAYAVDEQGNPDTRIEALRSHKLLWVDAIIRLKKEISLAGKGVLSYLSLPQGVIRALSRSYDILDTDTIIKDIKSGKLSIKTVDKLGNKGFYDLCEWAGVNPEKDISSEIPVTRNASDVLGRRNNKEKC